MFITVQEKIPLKTMNTKEASTAPIIGPKMGTQAYFQSLLRFIFIGRKKCMSLGPRSRAGLMAYPVGPPSDKPIPSTTSATGRALSEPSPTSG